MTDTPTDISSSSTDKKPSAAAPVVEPNPACGARVDYHGGTCGRPVGHDEPCAPVVEPERMPCGHTHAAIVSSGEGTNYCGECVAACSPRSMEGRPMADDREAYELLDRARREIKQQNYGTASDLIRQAQAKLDYAPEPVGYRG